MQNLKQASKHHKMKNSHALVIPFPAFGHITPLVELSKSLALQHCMKITLLLPQHIRQKLTHSLPSTDQLSLASILDNELSQRDLEEFAFHVMPKKVEKFIQETEAFDCVIVDFLLGWGVHVAVEYKMKRVVFSANMAAGLVLISQIPNLIDQGIIDNHGNIMRKETIKLSPTMPSMNSSHFPWANLGKPEVQKLFFQHATKNNKSLQMADYILCNSAHELEPSTFETDENIHPIGPLLEANTTTVTNPNPQDSICLNWLDKQSPESVIYIAFGTTTFLNKTEFQELALGLELCNRPFLWVVRSDITPYLNEAYPHGFLEKLGSRGLVISWSPQKKVLEHPSIACFLLHCGWNSTLEAMINGVPLLCWPTFADQLLNANYVCNVWKNGLGIGVMKREEIRDKVEELLGNEMYRANALDLKDKLINTRKEGGSSYNNLKCFVEWVRS